LAAQPNGATASEILSKHLHGREYIVNLFIWAAAMGKVGAAIRHCFRADLVAKST
jgi:hypothetical protein